MIIDGLDIGFTWRIRVPLPWSVTSRAHVQAASTVCDEAQPLQCLIVPASGEPFFTDAVVEIYTDDALAPVRNVSVEVSETTTCP